MARPMSPFDARVAANLKRAREDAKIGRKDAAKTIGVDVSIMSRMESGHVGLSAERLVKLAKLYGVRVEAILETAPQRRSA